MDINSEFDKILNVTIKQEMCEQDAINKIEC